ncbi:MAG: hypothetical protein WCI78_02800 [Mycobacterium sp.]
MRFAVAIASPPDYEHGEAFREVAEGLHYGLLALGQDSVLTNRLDLDERRTIVLGSNLLALYQLEPPKDPILYNLEQVEGASWAYATTPLLGLFKRYPVWDYSEANIEHLVSWHVPRPTHVPIGYVPQLTRIASAPEDIDVLFYGSLNDRRRLILDKLQKRGLRVKWLFGVYGASRDAWIARSKIVINIHFFEAKVFEIARVSYLLANRRAVVSERGAHPNDERDLEAGIALAEYDELVDRCVELIGDERARNDLGERGYNAFCSRSQAAILHRALSAGLD